jgi:hypothetical protein
VIVSFRHKFVFVAVPKTATHAFRNALRPHLAANDWEQCVLFDKKYFPVKTLAEIGHGHVTWREAKPFLLPEMRATFFKFCTVRNPFERFVSYCRFINRDNQRMETDALGEMKRIIADEDNHRKILFRPQFEFVSDEYGQLAVDYVCRYENLQNDFDTVCEKLKLPRAKLKKINVSDSEKYQGFYDEELKAMVRDFYQKDFEIFAYK